MNHDRLIGLTNRVAVYATFALLYWVFIFLIITVFDLKIFREHMTEIFYLSLLGIFAILGGALVLNVMSNLSKISALLSQTRAESISVRKPAKAGIIAVVLSFPIICGLLFAGNFLSTEKKKNMLISSAQSLVSENSAQLSDLADYRFSKEYVTKAVNILKVVKKIDKFFPEVTLIMPDVIEGKKVFLSFNDNNRYCDKDNSVEKHMFIFPASHDERLYLEKVFEGQQKNYRFSYHKGNYELYFPTQVDGKNIVLYLSDYLRYGKFGS
jgi:hypothetical protein